MSHHPPHLYPLATIVCSSKGISVRKLNRTIVTKKFYTLVILQIIKNAPFVGHELFHMQVIVESFSVPCPQYQLSPWYLENLVSRHHWIASEQQSEAQPGLIHQKMCAILIRQQQRWRYDIKKMAFERPTWNRETANSFFPLGNSTFKTQWPNEFCHIRRLPLYLLR